MSSSSSSRKWSRIFKLDARAEVEDELSFHLEQRTQANIARGMDPESARHAAEQRLGDLKSIESECAMLLQAERRAEARSYFMKMSWLDFKLGFRMLAKYPGLTFVGGLAMAFAIWAGAGAFEFTTQIVAPTVPLPDGDRIVALQNLDVKASRVETQVLHDFVRWRQDLRSVQEIGAYRSGERNLTIANRVPEPIDVAEISAVAFSLTRVPPLLGRALRSEDEQVNATPVAVIGYDLWQRRFEGTTDIVGQIVKIGGRPTTIVGVMPAGYAFPINHNLWVPLQLNPLEYARREGPGISVFGRLAESASLEDARAELATLGKRASADFRDTHEHLRPRVIAYPKSIFDFTGAQSLLISSSNLVLVMLLMLICGNVALLMFARAATREAEIIVRGALGASRGRIVVQLFVEALVLGLLAAALGLSAAGLGMRWAMTTIVAELAEGFKLPFWFDARLSPATIFYALLLTVFGAAIAGVLPALKATRPLQGKLRESAMGSGPSFGGIWTAVIVAQVAVMVAFPFSGFVVRRDAVRLRDWDVGIAEQEYLTARLELDREPSAGTIGRFDAARYRPIYEELARRLATDPAVATVTYANVLPRMYHRHSYIDIDAGGAAPLHPEWPHYRVSQINVDPGYFSALDVPILTGRNFAQSDIASDHGVIIVNESFVQRVLGGRNPLGRRLHYKEYDDDGTAKEGPWYEIIGVVKDLGISPGTYDPKVSGIYHPVEPLDAYPLHLAIRLKSDPASFAPRLRQIAAGVDPGLRLYDPRPLNRVSDSELRFYSFWLRLLAGVSAIAVMLSLAGIYAVMAFTVSRRTREIGIRVALGSSPVPTVLAILRRPLTQVTLGIATGASVIGILFVGMSGGSLSLSRVGLLAAYSLMMMSICLLACVIPTRRALRIQPIDALKSD
jgi:putative ABC transport system permease protein